MEYYDDIIRAREIIKKKYNELRSGETEETARLEKYFKPVAEPLKAILRLKDKTSAPPKWLQVKKEENLEPLKKKEEEQEPKEEVYESADESEFENDAADNQEEIGYNDVEDVATNVSNDDANAEVDEVDVAEDESESQPSAAEGNALLLNSYIDTNFGPLFSSYFRAMITDGDDFDHSHGVRLGEGKQWMLGSKAVRFDQKDNLIIGENTFDTSPGLLELIFKRSPGQFSNEDLEKYYRILELTNAHRQNYEAGRPLRATSSKKYREIIRPFYKRPNKKVQKRVGEGMHVPWKKLKMTLSTNTEEPNLESRKEPVVKEEKIPAKQESFVPLETKRTYVYWDDPNELVERLALLVASKEAGHSGLEREILSIEEELREGGYIL